VNSNELLDKIRDMCSIIEENSQAAGGLAVELADHVRQLDLWLMNGLWLPVDWHKAAGYDKPENT